MVHWYLFIQYNNIYLAEYINISVLDGWIYAVSIPRSHRRLMEMEPVHFDSHSVLLYDFDSVVIG